MKTYYKYTKYIDLEKLIDFHIRLSAPATLNDPFESILNKVVEEKLKSKLSLMDLGYPDISGHFSSSIMERIKNKAIKNLINDYGVVSLSETPRNLLMWSHYANEHEGICIGFNEDLFEDVSHIPTEYEIEYYKPQKVNYDSMRPQNNEIIINPIEEVRVHARQQLLTKSDEWIYEKEHRCIIPLEVADKMLWLKSNNESSAESSVQAAIDDLRQEKLLDEIATNTYSGVGIMTLVGFANEIKGAIFLKKINPKSIKTIHLGCKMDLSKKKEIIFEITSPNCPLHHVKVIDCRLSEDRFELEMVHIN
ncbi:DUF2971 domain-containing protein [Aeromonas hydrophila]|uniref:DUF2971 domain-containing protein n=1 Tax=Aeromonas hydrophila TaxID=644 RepID=UPI001CEFD14D|nr:DUF2971 domain-containing protein [Aeromonas hydrophila]UCM63659.1 DUF2971 domain-containing protein [Aeromonas hydrophila]